MRLHHLLLLPLLALAGCDSPLLKAPAPDIGPQLTGEQIASALAGNSLLTEEDEVPPLVIFFSDAGEMVGFRSNNYRDEGTWEVQEDVVCGAWQNWYGTMSRCWKMFRAGDRITFRSADDDRQVTATLVSGNRIGG